MWEFIKYYFDNHLLPLLLLAVTEGSQMAKTFYIIVISYHSTSWIEAVEGLWLVSMVWDNG